MNCSKCQNGRVRLARLIVDGVLAGGLSIEPIFVGRHIVLVVFIGSALVVEVEVEWRHILMLVAVAHHELLVLGASKWRHVIG